MSTSAGTVSRLSLKPLEVSRWHISKVEMVIACEALHGGDYWICFGWGRPDIARYVIGCQL
jgi:hypothetical protein